MNRRLASLALCMGAALVLPQHAFAADEKWPTQPVRVVVNYPPGGSSDSLTRVALSRAGEALGASIVVENKPGANGNIGVSFVAKSKGDGYTLSATGLSGIINSNVYKTLDYRFTQDLVPVAMIGRNPGVLIVNKSLPVNSVQELIAYGKRNPEALNFASGGAGSSPHVNGEIFRQATGTPMTHVPYRGESPAVTDLIGGRVQVMFAVLATAKPLIDKGQVRALAVTSPERAEALPELPTLKESGIGFGVYSWLAIFAPRDTPEAVQQQLNTAIRQSLRDPQVKAKVSELGTEIRDMSLKELRDYVRSEDVYWREALKKVNVQLD
ncbi:Bug family tripartite tricarboxylate transporter substrate binding protein [Hydrogenophaga sp. BPS33]|uniref:Bug family tripartite tricarboxylate transporter substrate binding protein n=1 Tax=Hydrogenophaga sp. BPS33 TaxID=2651974 RepID=UPI00131F93E8|nr:tripartite tricarboxylate transporter substrate binding protein [Hydrogenophaga sp. BPS33]QHE83539.1 tripartite tricarboxylate transporter substrate binding protein [Hydrogenophaga sp. BPS33]